MVWLDAYERRARLVPGMLLLAPLAVVIVMFGLRSNPVVAATVGALTTFGAPVVLVSYVRQRGVAVQSELYDSWGGKPTTKLLRAGGNARARNWRRAAAQVSKQEFPPENQPDPEGRYDAAVAVLISRTRGDRNRFGMIFEENKNFGYERNLYGLRRPGRVFAGVCFVGSIAAVAYLVWSRGQSVRAEWVVGLVVLGALLLIWIFLPSGVRARVTAYKYAEQLLDAGVDLADSAAAESQ